jgi:hypothetical protein
MDRIPSRAINMIDTNNTLTDSLKGDHWGDKDLDMRIILKWIFKDVGIAYEDVGEFSWLTVGSGSISFSKQQ